MANLTQLSNIELTRVATSGQGYTYVNPYGDGNCFFHAMNFNLLNQALNNTLKNETENKVLDSGFVDVLINVAHRHGIHLRVDHNERLGKQLLTLLKQITREPLTEVEAKFLSGEEVLARVHWGVWQKLSGEALRRITNMAIEGRADFVKPNLFAQFIGSCKQRLVQFAYPDSQENFPLSAEYGEELLGSSQKPNEILKNFVSKNQVLLSEIELTNSGNILNDVTESLDHNESEIHQALKAEFNSVVYPKWVNRHANTTNPGTEPVGANHQETLKNLWCVNVLQPNRNPQGVVELVPMNHGNHDANFSDFVVEQHAEHYQSVLRDTTTLSKSLCKAVQQDKNQYTKATGRVESRFGDWDTNGFTRKIPETKPTPYRPITIADLQKALVRIEVNDASQKESVQLQQNLDEQMARYMAENQVDWVEWQTMTPEQRVQADTKLEVDFYQHFAKTRDKKISQLRSKLCTFTREQQCSLEASDALDNGLSRHTDSAPTVKSF